MEAEGKPCRKKKEMRVRGNEGEAIRRKEGWRGVQCTISQLLPAEIEDSPVCKRWQRARGLGGAHSTPTRPGLNRKGFTSERQQRNNPLRSEELRRGLGRKDEYRAKATEENQGNRGRKKERGKLTCWWRRREASIDTKW